MSTEPTEMPATFRAALDAACTRPLLLDPAVLAPLHASAAGLRARADVGGGIDDSADGFDRVGDVAVVGIDGPLSQRAWSCWCFEGDGYDAIMQRCAAALDDPQTRALVLRIDSPGGEVAGCFDAVRSIRAMADAAGKPVVAYADEIACSAAYALACAAERVVLPDTGTVGSIGVILSVASRAGELAQRGVAVTLITSGAAKADGHPHVPLGDGARARLQADVDQLAQVFASVVAQARPLDAEGALALEARTFIGAEAVRAGLADQVGTLADAVTTARSLADARAQRNAMDEQTKKALAMVAALKGSLNVESEDEVTAAVGALKVRAGQLDTVTAERDAARAELAARDARDAAAAREQVLSKHRARGALTPAMEADKAFMGDLAPLPAEALDRVLARIAPLNTADRAPKPRTPAGVDPEKAAAAGAEGLTTAERKQAKQGGLTDEEFLAQKRADAKRQAERAVEDDED